MGGLSPEADREKERALVLIPARNEAASIGGIVTGCRAAGFMVWVLDDGSADDTAIIAERAGATSIRRSPEGKTAILREALRQIPRDMDWIFFMDGDGQHDPGDLRSFWERRDEADLIIGNRWSDVSQMPRHRRIVNKLMTWLINRFSGGSAPDTQCGFRLVRRTLIHGWLPKGRHYEFETELYLLAIRRQGRIGSVPLRAVYGLETSKIFWPRDTWRFIRCLTR